MIISTGGRTDTVRHYSDWLLRRFEEGYVLVRNPLSPKRVSRLELDPDKVDCVVFCSKDYAPILARLHEVTGRFNTYFHYTITPYGTDVEPSTPSFGQSAETLAELSQLVGRQRVAWRYEPVLLTSKYTVDYHLDAFDRMAQRLAPFVDRCLFGFVEEHRALRRNMPELVPLADGDRDELARGFGLIAVKHAMAVQACGAQGDFARYGVRSSGCVTLEIVGHANGVEFAPRRHKGTRAGCERIESRDIGANGSCPSGCRYCYASPSPQRAAENAARHDPSSPLLLGALGPDDRVFHPAQRPFPAKRA